MCDAALIIILFKYIIRENNKGADIMAKAHVENYNGYPAIMIDGKPYPPMLATFYARKDDQVIIDHDYHKNFGKAGVKI